MINTALLVMGALPLGLYPFALIASLMGLGSQTFVQVPLFNRCMNAFFLWGSLCYPVVYLVCYWLNKEIINFKLVTAGAPILFLGLLAISSQFMDIPAKTNTKIDK